MTVISTKWLTHPWATCTANFSRCVWERKYCTFYKNPYTKVHSSSQEAQIESQIEWSMDLHLRESISFPVKRLVPVYILKKIAKCVDPK